jgi:predicted GNAT family N-acyltransferase
MAVDQPFRRRGIGGRILERLEEEARNQGMSHCVLHAQQYVKIFYAAYGYEEHGDVFLEVNIPHIEMRKDL